MLGRQPLDASGVPVSRRGEEGVGRSGQRGEAHARISPQVLLQNTGRRLPPLPRGGAVEAAGSLCEAQGGAAGTALGLCLCARVVQEESEDGHVASQDAVHEGSLAELGRGGGGRGRGGCMRDVGREYECE